MTKFITIYINLGKQFHNLAILQFTKNDLTTQRFNKKYETFLWTDLPRHFN